MYSQLRFPNFPERNRIDVLVLLRKQVLNQIIYKDFPQLHLLEKKIYIQRGGRTFLKSD